MFNVSFVRNRKLYFKVTVSAESTFAFKVGNVDVVISGV